MTNISYLIKKIETVFPAQELMDPSIWNIYCRDYVLGDSTLADRTFEQEFGRTEITNDWHQVPDEDLRLLRSTSISSFGNTDSWKYYLPALMRYTLKVLAIDTQQRSVPHREIEGLLDFLKCPGDWEQQPTYHFHQYPIKSFFTRFGITKAQADVIVKFFERLRDMEPSPYGYIDQEIATIARAIEEWKEGSVELS